MNRPNVAPLPCYLVVDVSWSMSLHGKIEAAGRLVSTVIDALARDPVARAVVRFGLIEFSGDARIRIPLGVPVGGRGPELTVRDGTSFGSLFALLENTIPTDLARLATATTGVRPPAIFILTDGGPTDDEREWRTALTALTALPARPSIIACGVDQAPVPVMRALVQPPRGRGGRLYLMDPTYPPAQAITAFADVIISSMLASSRRSDGRTVLPTSRGTPPGLTAYPITADQPGRRMRQNGPAGYHRGGNHGTMGPCRTVASSDARLNSPSCDAFSTEQPAGSRPR